MKTCMETDRPLVSIVMATYNPRMDWLREQLISLENQSYEALELIVLDDCSTKVALDEIKECVADCIKRIPYQILQNEENLGSTKTFEKLTLLAKGEYIAYCDQDDVWHRDKIEVLLSYFSKDNNTVLAYSDVRIIDESGNKKADGIADFRPRHVLLEGFGLAERLMIQNFVIGCTMLIKRHIATVAVPFIPGMVHDHYLALMASLAGEIVLCKEPLVDYRIHEDNQTNVLAKVKNKEDYYCYKIKAFCDRLDQLEEKNLSARIEKFSEIKLWAEARDSYFHGDFRSAATIWKYKKVDCKISIFELVMARMPKSTFAFALKKIKEGKI